MLDVFKYRDYKSFLRDHMPSKGEGRGARSRLAAALGLKLSFVSLVLTSPKNHFSLEQGHALAEFFEFTDEESHFFILLLSQARAGSKKLEKFYQAQIDKILIEREEVKSRIKTQSELSIEDQALYYSEWYFTALHMILRNNEISDLRSVSELLSVPYEKVVKALNFFEKVGIVIKKNNLYQVQDIRMHIDQSSPWLNLHHRNWRQKTISVLDNKRKEDLNYTLITSISEEVAIKIKALLLEAIQKSEPLIREAKDQTVYNLNIDFQKIF